MAEALWLSLKLAALTTLILLVIATPLAWWLARSRRWWKEIIAAAASLPIVLPPTVLGFYLLIALGRSQLATTLHKLSFFVWVACMTLHVLAHARKLPGAVASDWVRKQRERGPLERAAVLGVSLLVGVGLAAATVHLAGSYSHHRNDGGFGGDGH